MTDDDEDTSMTEPANTEARFATLITASQDTMEDYTETFIPPLAMQVDGRFAVVQDNGKDGSEPEVVSVDAGGKLVHFRHDPSAQSGWTRELVEVPGEPGEIFGLTAFYRSSGVLQVFIRYAPKQTFEVDESARVLVGEVGRSVVMTRSRDGKWSRHEPRGSVANVLGRVQQLGVHLDPEGRRYLFGITHSLRPVAFFVLAEKGDSEWSVAGMVAIQTGDVAYHLLAGYEPDQLMITRANGERLHYQPGQIRDGRLHHVGDERSVNLRHGQLSPDQILPFPGRIGGKGEVHFLFLGSRKYLDHVILRTGEDANVILLSGGDRKPGALTQVALSVDGDRRYTALVLDSNHELWVVRQAQTESGIRFATQWTAQGDKLRTLACPVTLTRGPELFAVDFRNQLVHTQQPLLGTADSWHTRVVEVPKLAQTKPDRCTSHTLEMCCRDRQGVVVPDTVVHLSSDRHTTVYIDGFSYTLSPARTVPVRTDRSGRVSVRVIGARVGAGGSMICSDLTAPRIHATLRPPTGAPIEHAFAPDLSLYKRMADERSMTGARLRNSPLVDPNRIDAPTADALAAMCRHAANKRLRQDAGQDSQLAGLCAEPLETKRWSLRFREGGVEVGQPTAEQFEAAWAEAEVAQANSEDSIRSFGDFIRWVMNKAKAFAEAVIEISGDAFKLIFDGIKTFVIEIGKEIGQFFEGLFKRLAEAFNRAIDAAGALLSMFEALFHWDDIITTKNVLKTSFLALLTSLGNSLQSDIPAELRRRFQAARKQLDASFSDARAKLGDKRFEQIAVEARPGQPNPFADERFSKLGQSHGVQATYVSRLSMQAVNTAKFAGPEPTAAELAQFEGFVSRLKTIFVNAGLEQAEKDISEKLAELGKDPSRFLQVGLSVLLSVVEAALKVTLSVAEELLVVLLELLGGALVKFRGLLEEPIHNIPIISGLYQQLTGSPLSLLDAACLMLAAPATIIYKLVRGGQAPFVAADVDKVRQTMARYGDLRRIIEGPSADELAADPVDTRTLETVFGICGACLTYVAMPMTAIDDAVAMAEADVPMLPIIMATVWGLGMGLSWPMSVADKPFAQRSVSDHLTLGIWYGEVAWFGFSGLITALMPTKAPKWLPFVGPVLCCIRGAIRSIAAVVAIVANSIEGSPNGVINSVQNLIKGLVDVNRIAIPAVKRGGKLAPVIALWIFGVGTMGDIASFALQLAATLLPQDQLALEVV